MINPMQFLDHGHQNNYGPRGHQQGLDEDSMDIMIRDIIASRTLDQQQQQPPPRSPINVDAILSKLKEDVYHRVSISPNNNNQQTECPICLESFEQPDKVLKLPCSHFFHPQCILPWIHDHHDQCPFCRAPIVPNQPPTTSTNVSNQAPPITPMSNGNPPTNVVPTRHPSSMEHVHAQDNLPRSHGQAPTASNYSRQVPSYPEETPTYPRSIPVYLGQQPNYPREAGRYHEEEPNHSRDAYGHTNNGSSFIPTLNSRQVSTYIEEPPTIMQASPIGSPHHSRGNQVEVYNIPIHRGNTHGHHQIPHTSSLLDLSNRPRHDIRNRMNTSPRHTHNTNNIPNDSSIYNISLTPLNSHNQHSNNRGSMPRNSDIPYNMPICESPNIIYQQRHSSNVQEILFHDHSRFIRHVPNTFIPLSNQVPNISLRTGYMRRENFMDTLSIFADMEAAIDRLGFL